MDLDHPDHGKFIKVHKTSRKKGGQETGQMKMKEKNMSAEER